MKSTKQPTKRRGTPGTKGTWALQASNLRPSDYEEGNRRSRNDLRTGVRRSSAHSSGSARKSGTRGKGACRPTIRPTSRRRKRLIHDITSRSLSRR